MRDGVEKIYHAQSSLTGLDQTSHSQIEASRARGLMEEHHSQIGKGDDEDRFGKCAVGPNRSNLTARGMESPMDLQWQGF